MFRDGMLEQKKMKVPSHCSQLSFDPPQGLHVGTNRNFIESASDLAHLLHNDSDELMKSWRRLRLQTTVCRLEGEPFRITGTSVKSGLRVHTWTRLATLQQVRCQRKHQSRLRRICE